MNATTDTLREWIRAEVLAVLGRKSSPPPLLLWCDPDGHWRDLLRAAAEGGAFELWGDEAHQLALRERLYTEPPTPRVVWLPVAADGITWLKVFELQAERVWTEPLVSALARFGVELPRDQEAALRPILPAHAREWIDRPRAAWRELTPGTAASTLVDDDLVLQALSSRGVALAAVVGEGRVAVLARRVTEDFGLPAPTPGHDDAWRVAATARLLATEATVRVPAEPPSEGERVIPASPARERAMKLLDRWRRDVHRMGAFEALAGDADALTALVHWARNVRAEVAPLGSRAAEEALFQREVEGAETLGDFEALARRLEAREPYLRRHAGGFWGEHAERRVPWRSLRALAVAASTLRAHADAAQRWRSIDDAVQWFTGGGWEVDREGEALFRDDGDFPPGLLGARARLRRAYQRHLDETNRAFSELLARHGVASLELPYAGEVLAGVRGPKEPLAVLVLDACRFDLGARLADRLNRAEPARRAEVRVARAPLPSITALGMAFALADDPASLRVELTAERPPRWRVFAGDHPRDLAGAEARREWLRERFKLGDGAVTQVKRVLDEPPPGPKEAGKRLFVFGDEFDVQGHEGELQFGGAEELVERYARAIWRLRDAGYPFVAVVTDHGFLHWAPEADEKDDLPRGELSWSSRRAAAGRGLGHPTALAVPVPGSDLECRVPRSVNAFRTYGRVGFFHGGATLQELVTPVVIARWPQRAAKVPAVLTSFAEITGLRPRVEVRPGTMGTLPGIAADTTLTGRLVQVKVVEPGSGRRLFGAEAPARLDPGGAAVAVILAREEGETCPRGTRLRVEVRDADNDELLDGCDAVLKVDIEEWD